MHAPRDLDEVVGRNHKVDVATDQSITVMGNRSVDVVGNVSERTAGSRVQLTAESVSAEIGASKSVVVHGTEARTIKSSRATIVQEGDSLRVSGNYTMVVGTEQQPRVYDAYVFGDHVTGTQGSIRLVAEESIVLGCGDSFLALTPDGIHMEARNLSAAGTEVLELRGKGPSLTLREDVDLVGKAVRVYSRKASLELEDDAYLNGTTVRLNCDGPPAGSSDARRAAKTKRLTLKLTSETFVPYAGKDYLLVTSGRRFEGVTDSEGKVEHDVPEWAKAGMLTLWLGERPTGEMRRYRINLEDLPDVSTPLGAQRRLINLGYLWGAASGDLDALTKQALGDLQFDHKLEVTNDLDDATKKTLVDLHGY